jgi:sulfur carrier protein
VSAPAQMKISLNGEAVLVRPGATLSEALALLEISAGRGFAAAVDAEVVPRGQWEHRELTPGARIEVVTAIQGG